MKRSWLMLLLIVLLTLSSSPVAASGPVVHVVQPGQTLTSIARWYGVDPWTLARVNGIVNPNFIYVGQRLAIPGSGSSVPTGRVYIVRPGDTLYRIAGAYGVTAWAIAQANGIYNLNAIYVGQRLVIPTVTPPAPTPVPTPKPTAAPTPAGSWKGEYFNSTTPSGGPVVVRYDPAINFHWGLAAPVAGVNADSFSVHWTRNILFKGGVYRFSTVVDDGVRIWVDGRLILDAWKVQPEAGYAVDVVIDPGYHVVAVDYFDASAVATIRFSFTRLGSSPAPTPTPTPTPATPPTVTAGWHGSYFANQSLSGTPTVTQIDPAIGFEWGAAAPVPGLPADHFSVRWTQRASFYGDNYAFCAMSDDGVRIYLDGHLVLDEWHASNGLAYCAEANVTAGEHDIRVDYYEDGGNALIYVWWERR